MPLFNIGERTRWKFLLLQSGFLLFDLTSCKQTMPLYTQRSMLSKSAIFLRQRHALVQRALAPTKSSTLNWMEPFYESVESCGARGNCRAFGVRRLRVRSLTISDFSHCQPMYEGNLGLFGRGRQIRYLYLLCIHVPCNILCVHALMMGCLRGWGGGGLQKK